MGSERCRHTIDGPKVGRWVVFSRTRCKNRTRRKSGLCWQHDPEWIEEWNERERKRLK